MDGARYVSLKNGGFSVTEGGPRFDLQGFEVDNNDEDEADPFSSYNVCERASVHMTFLNPGSPEGQAVGDRMRAYAEECWLALALRVVDAVRDDLDPPRGVDPAPNVPRTPEERLADAIHKASSSTKVFKAAERLIAQYSVFLACPPENGRNEVVIPELSKAFIAVLREEKGIDANALMQDMYRTPLKALRRSPIAMERDASLRLDQVNLAWSDAFRTFNFIDEPMVDVPLERAKRSWNLMHCFTPLLAALSASVANEEGVRLITRANVHDPKAALEAAKKSELFCGGSISTGRQAYEMIVNARAVFAPMIVGDRKPIVVQCLEEVADLLTSEKGKKFFARHHGNTDIPLHIFTDNHAMVATLFNVAKDPEMHEAVREKKGLAFTNYGNTLAVHRNNLTDLKQAMAGSGLGKFKETPEVAHWFRRPDASRERSQRSPTAQEAGGPPKKARTAEDGTQKARGGGGLLTYSPPEGKSDRLPIKEFDVFGKSKDGKTTERVCVQFLVQGHSCKRGKECKFLHVTRLDQLSQPEQEKFMERVRTIDGLEWAPGKAPPGMD